MIYWWSRQLLRLQISAINSMLTSCLLRLAVFEEKSFVQIDLRGEAKRVNKRRSDEAINDFFEFLTLAIKSEVHCFDFRFGIPLKSATKKNHFMQNAFRFFVFRCAKDVSDSFLHQGYDDNLMEIKLWLPTDMIRTWICCAMFAVLWVEPLSL